MPIFQRTTAVCLHKVDFSETSQILRFFTAESGKINCIAKGSKRKKSAFLAPFELLSVYDLIRIEKRPGTLDILTKAERIRSFTKLRAIYPSYVAACYAAEFIDEFSPEAQPIEGLYEQLIQVLERLEAGLPAADATFSFEAQSLRALGYLPRLRECGICRKPAASSDLFFSVRDGGALHTECRPREERWFPVRRGSLESIARFSDGDMPREAMKRPLVIEIRQIFDACVRFHLERDLKSVKFLRETIATAAAL